MKLNFVNSLFLLLIISSLKINAYENTYQKILEKQVTSDGPGMAAIIMKGDKTIFHGAHGMASIELGVPLKPDSVFRIGSITKQFTGAAIMMLDEQGKLSVNDELKKYVPDFPTGDNKVTLAHLLTHTSGINSYTDNEHTMKHLVPAPVTLDEMLEKFAKEPILFETGERMRYSNTGYVLLGKVIEVVTGRSYQDFIEKEIFEKLGMKNSQYGGRQIVFNRATGYTHSDDGIKNADLIDMSWPYAAGSLISTVEDLAIWNKALVSGKVVSLDGYQRMITPFKLNNGTESPYGYGLRISNFGKYETVGHGGGIPGFSTNSVYIPEKDIFIAVFTNNDTQNPMLPTQVLAAEALGIKLPNFTPVKVSKEKLTTLMGAYAINDKSVRVLSMDEGKVYTQRDNGQKWEVIPMSENSFYYEGSLTYFVIEEENGKTVMNFYSSLSETPNKAFKH